MFRHWVVSVCLLALAAPVAAQSVETYAWVHRTLVNLESPPWRCVCYSVSRASTIDTGNADNQVWVVSRFNDWDTAMAARNALSGGTDVCSFCPATEGTGTNLEVFVYSNCTTGICEIGVAESDYNEPGWSAISPAFGTHPEAWRYACSLHGNANYVAPAIREGVIDCNNLSSTGDRTSPIEGKWSGWGKMTLHRSPSGFIGTYDDTYESGLGRIELRFTGGQWSGTWSEPKIGREGRLYDIELSSDGKRLTGKYDVTQDGSRGSMQKDVSFSWSFSE